MRINFIDINPLFIVSVIWRININTIYSIKVLSDAYARSYKDIQRPVIIKKQRVMMVAGIKFVDFVYISDVSPSSIETLQLLKPASVVFGKDPVNTAKVQQRIANVAVASPDTKVRFLPRYIEEEVSTSSITNKIRGT